MDLDIPVAPFPHAIQAPARALLPDCDAMRRNSLTLHDFLRFGQIYVLPTKTTNLRHVHAGKNCQERHFLFRIAHRLEHLIQLGKCECGLFLVRHQRHGYGLGGIDASEALYFCRE